jgi:hypothetical protein
METHAHHLHKAPGKNFWHYFFEFFMLFLAVFCGFLAENFREHQVEKSRARQYVQSFCEDLKNDTARINLLLTYDNEKIAALMTMYNCYDTVSKDLEATACLGELVKHSRSNRGFVLTQRTIQQLSNAGGYRLLAKQDADSINSYENAYRAYLDFQSTVFQSSQDNVRNTLNRIANFKVIAPMQLTTANLVGDTMEGKLQGPLFFVKDKNMVNEWFNELAMYLRTSNGQKNIMMQLKNRATGLLQFFSNKYQLE